MKTQLLTCVAPVQPSFQELVQLSHLEEWPLMSANKTQSSNFHRYFWKKEGCGRKAKRKGKSDINFIELKTRDLKEQNPWLWGKPPLVGLQETYENVFCSPEIPCNGIFQNCVHLTELYVDVSSAVATAASQRKAILSGWPHRLWTWAVRRGDVTEGRRGGPEQKIPMGCEDKQPEGRSPLPSEQEGRVTACSLCSQSRCTPPSLWPPVSFDMPMSLIIPILCIHLFAVNSMTDHSLYRCN